jgi:hypothetical protein
MAIWNARIQVRRDIAANWVTNNPVLSDGEWGVETNTLKYKLGDGATSWTSLPYSIPPFGNTAGTITEGNDARLSDARTPTAHASTHAVGGADALTASSIGAASDTDPRLSDARTPTLHAASHTAGQADAVSPASIGAAETVHTHTASNITDFTSAAAAAAPVQSVASKTGIVTLAISDIANLQTTLDAKIASTEKGATNGVATLDGSGKLPSNQVPDIAITEYLGIAANESAMLALTGQRGDWCVRSDSGTTWVITGTVPSQIGDWTQLAYPAAPVTSVAGKTGAVTLTNSDVGLGNVTNVAQAPATRTITTGSGLTGGGNLTADRTLSANFGSSAGTVCQGNDARLSDARTPTAHAGTHATGQPDAISPASIGASAVGHGHNISDITNLQTTLDSKVPNTRTINSGTGLSGGGDLSTNRTLSVSYGTTAGTSCQGNDARLSDARTPLAHTHPISDVISLQTSLDGKVPTSRTITSGTGLSGGGDLSANRTLSVSYGTTSGTACQGNDARLSDARTPLAHTHPISDVISLQTSLDGKVPTSRTITTGTGLSGGGNLTANRTFTATAQRITGSYTVTILNPVAGANVALDLYCPAGRTLTSAYGITNTGTVSAGFTKNLSNVGMPVLTATAFPGSSVAFSGANALSAGNSFGFVISAVSGATSVVIQVNFTELATVL